MHFTTRRMENRKVFVVFKEEDNGIVIRTHIAHAFLDEIDNAESFCNDDSMYIEEFNFHDANDVGELHDIHVFYILVEHVSSFFASVVRIKGVYLNHANAMKDYSQDGDNEDLYIIEYIH